jgi:hypothetical protein
MTLNASGPISLAGTIVGQSAQIELGGTGTTVITMNDTNLRTLAAAVSTQWSMNDLFGKSIIGPPVTITISSNIQNFNIYNNRITSQHGSAVTVSGSYSSGSTITVVVNSGVVVGSSSTGLYGFDTGTGWGVTDILKLTNNGYIVGAGGAGRDGADFNQVTTGGGGGLPGFQGGIALRAQKALSITNIGTIGGGGGGGGCQGGPQYFNGVWFYTYGGAGGGGGAGSSSGIGGQPSIYSAGSGAGTAGTLTTGGAAGVGAAYGGGGPGGNLGQTGGAGNTVIIDVIPGGGAGGAPGASVYGSANITWVTIGTVLGPII